MDNYIDQIANSVSLNYGLQQLAKENAPRIHFNFVILDDYLIFIRMPLSPNKVKRYLIKHITIASRSEYARFAGEIWYIGYNQFLVSNNLGTYRPLDRLLRPVVQLFERLSSHVRFQGVTYRFSAQKPI